MLSEVAAARIPSRHVQTITTVAPKQQPADSLGGTNTSVVLTANMLSESTSLYVGRSGLARRAMWERLGRPSCGSPVPAATEHVKTRAWVTNAHARAKQHWVQPAWCSMMAKHSREIECVTGPIMSACLRVGALPTTTTLKIAPPHGGFESRFADRNVEFTSTTRTKLLHLRVNLRVDS